MHDHQVALGDHSLDVQRQVRVLPAQPVDEAGERLGPVLGIGVVLDIAGAEVIRDRQEPEQNTPIGLNGSCVVERAAIRLCSARRSPSPSVHP